MKNNKFYVFIFMCMAMFFSSCSEDGSKPVILPFYSLDMIAGYTYTTTFTSSSGKELNPSMTIFNSERLDWNMSSSNMGNNQFYYTASGDAFYPNVWTMYWYINKGDAVANKPENAAMSVKIGINNLEKITVLVSAADAGAGSSMAGTPLTMTLASHNKNTSATAISSENQNVNDTEISVNGENARWPFECEKIFYGEFNFLVGENGSVAKGTGSSGDNVIPSVKIVPSGDDTVNITSPKMIYGGMEVMPFIISGVKVKKSGEIYYLEKSEFTSSDGNYFISGKSVSGQLEEGVLTLRLQFIPGAMPFLITEIFISETR